MKNSRSACMVLAFAALIVAGGCAGQNDASVLDASSKSLEGTWDYLLTNAYDSTFTGCSGDAVVLEGMSFAEGQAVAPICVVATRFEVQQQGVDGVLIMPHSVSCSDGSSADMSGAGFVAAGSIAGQWISTSQSGVEATQSFTGTMSGDTLQITENARSFSGGFSGSCNLSPALSATARVF